VECAQSTAIIYAYVVNDPLSLTDPSGKFWHIVAGAAIGAVSNMFFNIIEQQAIPCPFDWWSLAGEGVAGCVSGGFTAAFPMTGALRTIGFNFAMEGTGQIIENLAVGGLSGRKTNPFDGALSNAMGGAIAGGGFKAMTNGAEMINRATPHILNGIETGIGDGLSSGIGLAGDANSNPQCGCK
jgi:hypothetical protein